MDATRDLPDASSTLHGEGRARSREFSSPSVAALEGALDRGDLTTDAWVEVLRAPSSGRTPADLWQVLENADAPLEARGAAAVALGPALDEAGRARFQAIKADSPYPLRFVLKVAGASDVVAMVRGLHRCHDDA